MARYALRFGGPKGHKLFFVRFFYSASVAQISTIEAIYQMF